MADDVEPILEEALDNFRESTQRLRATQNGSSDPKAYASSPSGLPITPQPCACKA